MFKIVERTWGYYQVLSIGEGYKVKLLVFTPYQKTSLQLHFKRTEHITIAKGRAKIITGSKELLLAAGEHIYIPVETKHQIDSADPEMLYIEVQYSS